MFVNLQHTKDNCAGLYASTVYGPTCDSTDKLNDDVLLPELNIGDWLYYENAGAYTVCLQTAFCGFPRPTVYYYCTDDERLVKQQTCACCRYIPILHIICTRAYFYNSATVNELFLWQ